MHVSDAYVCEISGRNSFKGGRVGNPKQSEFLKKGKTVISIEKPEYF